MKARIGAVTTLVSLLAIQTAAGATAYVSNLGNTWPDGGIGDIHNIFAGDAFAARFSTGVGSFRLNFVTFEFLTATGLFTPNSWTNVTVQLYQEVGGQYMLRRELGNPVVDSNPTQWPSTADPYNYTSYVDFRPATQTILDPLAQYLVAAGGSPSGASMAAGLLFTDSYNYIGPADWQMGFTSAGTYDGTRIGDVNPPFFQPIKFAVTASPVPEPNSAILVLLGCVALGRAARRQ